MKTHQGIRKRIKKSKTKKGKIRIKRQSKGRGSKHLKSKQSNARKRRIKQVSDIYISKTFERIIKSYD